MAGESTMRAYIFVTAEGYTYQPGSEECEPDVENLQVLGWRRGETAEAAFAAMLQERGWLRETGFTECFAVELKEADSFERGQHFQLLKRPRRKKGGHG